jgi:SAM-dependent methyltransferase
VDELTRLYDYRFPQPDRRTKEEIWEVLCSDFFQRYVEPTDTVLDLACGFGEFIRFINARRKIAVDINPGAASILPPDVEFHAAEATLLTFLEADSVDLCFASNFFEHLLTKHAMDVVLGEVRRVLRPGGLFVALQPNIKYTAREYWDYYDHHLPLSHLSCAEAFAKAGFDIAEVVSRFLPFSTRSNLPTHRILIKMYLRIPLLWRLMGRQFLIVARKPKDR